jgi:type IV secretion system protein VirB4
MERIELSPLGFNGLKKHRAERLVSAVIPVEGHLTEGIVKTRGGALVAAFELAGTAFEAKTLEQRDLYKEQLNVALRNIATPRLALWSCLIRRREHVDLSVTYPNAFAQQVADGYAALQRRRNLYRNRLLLFLVYRTTALRSETALSKKVDKRLVRDLLLSGIDALEGIAVKLGASLRDYGPRRLGIYRHQGAGIEGRVGNRFSQIGEAYSLLLNHTGARVPVGPFDMAEAIATSRLLYGHEAFEIRQPAKSVYGAALAIKEYPERTYPEMFRSIMDLPFDFNWVQSFAFVEKETARKMFVQQRNRLLSAGDEAATQIAALDDALDELVSNRFAVGEHNATLVVYSDDLPEMSANLSKAQAALSDPGCVVVREDMALEGQVFSTLPGNTKYRARTAPGITSLNFAAMSPFFDFPVGRRDGHHWGEALTLLRSTVDTPVWFSSHVDDVGHMSVLGMTGAGKTALLAFLLAQMQRFKARHVILDKDQGLKIAVLALGGQYRSLKTGDPIANPFALPYSARHANYLHDLIKLLARGTWSAKASKEVEEAIRAVYSLKRENRRLSSLLSFLDTTELEGVAERLHPWVGDGRYAWAFDNQDDTLDMGRLTGFDVTEFLEQPELRTPITSYLLYRIEPLIDGSPFALWIDEFWRLLDDAHFEDFVRDKLKTIRKKNGIVVTSTQSPSDALKSNIAAALLEQTPTKIFLPNEFADEADYRDGFKLTDAEWRMFRPLTKSMRTFLVKQTEISALVDFDLAGMDEEMAVLSGTEKNIRIVETIEAENGGTLPPDWLEIFHNRRTDA